MSAKLAQYLTSLQRCERSVGDGLTAVAKRHADEVEIAATAPVLAAWSYAHVDALEPIVDAFGKRTSIDLKLNVALLFGGPRSGPDGLLDDLVELAMLVGEVEIMWKLAAQGAQALRHAELLALCEAMPVQTERQKMWLETQIKTRAPQLFAP